MDNYSENIRLLKNNLEISSEISTEIMSSGKCHNGLGQYLIDLVDMNSSVVRIISEILYDNSDVEESASITSNEISRTLRELADRVDNEIPDAQAFVIAIGDKDSSIRMSGYFGSIEPAHDVGIHMLANAIIEMNNRRAEEAKL